jgi:hypothetical protein
LRVLGAIIYLVGACSYLYTAYFLNDRSMEDNDWFIAAFTYGEVRTGLVLVGIAFVFLGSVLWARARTRRSPDTQPQTDVRSNGSIQR